MSLKENDLKDRLFCFAINILRMLGTIKGGKETEVIKYQLSKSSTSSGANYEEAQAAVSRTDFGYKISISLKEMRESNYWLRILGELYKQNSEIVRLINESIELKNILGSISVKVSPRN